MFTTEGNANQDGGYVRHHLQKLTADSRSSLSAKLDSVFENINDPVEKRNANTA
jgi:type IV pilus assembly protein PilY1